MKFIDRLFHHIFRATSIKNRLKLSYVIIILIVLIPSTMSITFSNILTYHYDQLIQNVDNANNLNEVIKIRINNEIWDIVSGKKDFASANQYKIIEDIYKDLDELYRNSSTKNNRQLIEVAKRAMSTLKNYVDMLGLQIEEGAPVSENEKLLEEIRAVSTLVYDINQEFIFNEIGNIARVNESLQRTGTILTILEVSIFIFATLFAVYTFTTVAQNISAPILKLKNLSVQIAEGNLEARVEPINVDELKELTHSLNVMAGRIRGLIDDNVRELKNLQKAEMKALQAQINPHFLYNTFDTIIWLAESGDNEKVVSVAMAFSNFFRISLSKGKDWITVREEVEHVKSYLTIQRVRYQSILDFSIEVDESILEYPMLKLLLQPLVENALYHGVKFRRARGGIIKIKGWQENEELCFSVEDNGIGISPERLDQILESLNDDKNDDNVGYGLYNVNKRIKLFYETARGLKFESQPGKGTRVSFRLPCRSDQNV